MKMQHNTALEPNGKGLRSGLFFSKSAQLGRYAAQLVGGNLTKEFPSVPGAKLA